MQQSVLEVKLWRRGSETVVVEMRSLVLQGLRCTIANELGS